MLAFVPLLAPAAISAATAIVLLVFLMSIQDWWLPQQPDTKTPRYHYFTRLRKWTASQINGALVAARKKLAAALSRGVSRRSQGAVRAMNNITELALRTAGTFADGSRQTYEALYALRHVTVPALITGAVRPILTRLGVVEALAAAAVQTLTGISTAFADGLRALPWGVPAGIVSRVDTFFVTYKRLWDKVWNELGPRTTQLWTQIVPELRQRIEALERGVGGAGGAAIGQIRQRVEALERQAANVILPRIANLEAAVAALSAEVFGDIGTGLLELVERVTELERRLETFVTVTFAELEARVAELELAFEAAIETILERFGERILELERQISEVIPQRLAALELAVETLVATALEGLEVGLIDLTGRIVALETQIRDVILPGFEAIVGRITALETRIEDEMLPRITALEELLAPAAFAALVLATMRRVAPNLFCRNVTRTTEAICAEDEAFWDALLAGTLLFALALNPREVAAAGQALTGALGGVIAETVDH